jgi:hypothetical protein
MYHRRNSASSWLPTKIFENNFGSSEVSSRVQTDRQSDGWIVFSRRSAVFQAHLKSRVIASCRENDA